MESSASVLVVAAAGNLKWIDVLLLAIFALGTVLVVLVPFTIDLIQSHRTYRALITADREAAARGDGPRGVQGLARASMAFAVILVIGLALAYILVKQPFADNKTIAGNILVALTTTLASITAFYFGSRLASEAHRDAAEAAKEGAAATTGGGGTETHKDVGVTIVTPPDGALYTQYQNVVASYTCTPGAGAQITQCAGPVSSGSAIDTSQLGQHAFTVQATDSAGRSTQVTHTYTVQ